MKTASLLRDSWSPHALPGARLDEHTITSRAWARRDSNPEPRDYESPALTVELQALTTAFHRLPTSELSRSVSVHGHDLRQPHGCIAKRQGRRRSPGSKNIVTNPACTMPAFSVKAKRVGSPSKLLCSKKPGTAREGLPKKSPNTQPPVPIAKDHRPPPETGAGSESSVWTTRHVRVEARGGSCASAYWTFLFI